MTNTLISTSPGNSYAILGEVSISTDIEIENTVKNARAAQKDWEALGIESRIKKLHRLLDLITSNTEQIAEIVSKEMGQPITLSTSQTAGAISSFKWNLQNAPGILEPEITFEDELEINQVIHEPYGVGACIMAWNFPLPNFVWSVLPALIAGNTMVVKYSEEIPLFAKMLEGLCHKAGLEDIVSFVFGDGQVGAKLTDQNIDFISFTGSYAVGQTLYQKAASKFIPVILELGGSSPAIVFDDTDLDSIVEKIYSNRFVNCGQFCSDLKRLIVHNSIKDELTQKLVEIAKAKKVGDPLSKDTDMGPLVAERQVLRLEEQLADALSKGAKIEHGGKRPANLSGAYFEPTILSSISKDMKVWHEEVFGPMLPIVGFDTYEEAITLANDTEFGLTGYVYTKDQALAQKAMRDIKAGGVSANISHIFRPQNPFGGCKHSGIGRENGKYGYHDVCQIKILSWEK